MHHQGLYLRIIKAKKYMDACFGQPVSLSDIANEASLSAYHFLRLFKEIYGQTPYRYLTTRRMEKAAEWLAGSEYTINDICLMAGFESVGSFSALFKKYKGYSPAAYRKMRFHQKMIRENAPQKLAPHCITFMLGPA